MSKLPCNIAPSARFSRHLDGRSVEFVTYRPSLWRRFIDWWLKPVW